MRQTSYEDADGRKIAVLLPDEDSDVNAPMGFRLGPPSLESLDLPEDVEIRLHNQLFERRLFTQADIRARRQDIFGALQATLKVDIARIAALYMEEGKDGNRQKVTVTQKLQKRKTKGR